MSEPVAPSQGNARSRRRDVIVWLALAMALSPVLLEMLQHMAARPWAAPPLVFAALLARASWRERDSRLQSNSVRGLAALAAAAAAIVVGVGAEQPGIARLGVPLGVVGVALFLGRPRLRLALLSIWLLPLPSALAQLASPASERLLAKWAAAVCNAIGPPVARVSSTLLAHGSELELTAMDVGAPLLWTLLGASAFRAVQQGDSLPCTLRVAIRWLAVGLVLQWLAVVASTLLLTVADAPRASRFLLDWGIWLPALIALSLGGERELRARARSPRPE